VERLLREPGLCCRLPQGCPGGIGTVSSSIAAADEVVDPSADGRLSVRVRIGVTGHRDLADADAIAVAVRERLREIEKRFRSSAGTPVVFVVYSALAEGADRVVPHEAFGVFGEGRVQLTAVLPLSIDDYQSDFTGAASRSEFGDLLERAAALRQMPSEGSRNQAYARAGRWLVERCDVLIAVWDGRWSGEQGGTAETVRYAHEQGVPVLVVPAARAGNPPGSADSATPTVGVAVDRVPRLALDRVDELNRLRLRDPGPHRQLVALESRLEGIVGESSLASEFELVAGWALPRLVRADWLARKYQRLHYRLAGSLYVSAALAVTAVAIQIEAGLSERFAFVEVALLCAALAMFAVARWLGPHERWLGYRSLAEAFRAGLFIALTGSKPGSDADEEGELATTDEPWFQRVFSQAWEQRPKVPIEPSHARELRRVLIAGWIDDQIQYLQRTEQRLKRERGLLTNAVFLLFAATLLVGLLHALGLSGAHGSHNWLAFLAISLPGFAAALAGIRDQRDFRIHEQRCKRTARQLSHLRDDLETRPTLPAVQRLAAEAQAILASESLEWSNVVEFKELDLAL